MENTHEKIEIYISCRSLKNMDILTPSDPQVVAYLRYSESDPWNQIGKTEIIWNNLNPNFVTTIQVDYIFEKQQYIKFDVRDCDSETKFNYIGFSETTIGAIVGSKNSIKIIDIEDYKDQKSNGKIILRAEKCSYSTDFINILIRGKSFPNYGCFKFLGGQPNPFLKFYKIIEGKAPLLVYQTEIVSSTVNPKFKPIEINSSKFCNGDLDNQIMIEAWSYRKNIGNHNYLGSCKLTVASVIKKSENSSQTEYALIDSKKPNTKGILIFEEAKLIYKPQFLDYIKTGTQLQLMVAIDFTASNGEPHIVTSLHNYNNDNNQYLKAIQAVGDILINYDSDKMVPVFGFGGKKASKTVDHCFPLNGNEEDAEVYGVHGIIQIYKKALEEYSLSGPTYFQKIIEKSMAHCREILASGSNSYIILLILTDGEIHDMDITKRLIVDSSHLPLSIIIVGIGNANFNNMEILDGDDGLVDSTGRKAQRDLVQFVPFNEFKGDPIKLAESVLEELPTQLVEYMTLVNRQPPRIDTLNINQIEAELIER